MNMKTLFAAILFLISGIANAGAIQARSGDVSVTLFDTPCVSEKAMLEIPKVNALLVEIQIPPVSKAELQAAKVFWQGKNYDACWALRQGNVIVMDDAGLPSSVGAVPVQMFREVPEI